MSDQQTIDRAYTEKLVALFAVLCDGLKASSAAQRAEAEVRFAAGLRLARYARERALALIEPGD